MNHRPIASYEMHDTFRITGRGIVFIGFLLHGEFAIGDRLHFEFQGKELDRKITGIDWAVRTSREKPSLGIMIECQDEVEIDALRDWTPEKVVGKVYRKIAKDT